MKIRILYILLRFGKYFLWGILTIIDKINIVYGKNKNNSTYC